MDKLIERCKQYGQEELINYIIGLKNTKQQQSLLQQLQRLDLRFIETLYKTQCVNITQNNEEKYKSIQPLTTAHYINDSTEETENQYNQLGNKLISRGEVCVLILAGGSGTRLGFEKPKGMYNIGLYSEKSLFQIFSERILSLQQLVIMDQGFCKPVPILIMTSEQNDQETRDYFEEKEYFGLNPKQITFFQQDSFPMISLDGKILLESPDKILQGPNGNGGFISSLHSQGILRNLQKQGVKYLHLTSVDNVLTKLADPRMAGYIAVNKLLVCSKFVMKVNPDEKVGLHAAVDGKPSVVEYSEIPDDKKKQTDIKGDEIVLVFNAGNVAQMMCEIDFLFNIVEDKSLAEEFARSYHVAQKKYNYFDFKQNKIVQSNTINTYKFELFYYDIFMMCPTEKLGLLEIVREDEFGPVKNANGAKEDTPDTAKMLLANRDKHWLEKLGLKFKEENSLKAWVEISPKLTYFGENLDQYISHYRNRELTLPFKLKHPQEQELFSKSGIRGPTIFLENPLDIKQIESSAKNLENELKKSRDLAKNGDVKKVLSKSDVANNKTQKSQKQGEKQIKNQLNNKLTYVPVLGQILQPYSKEYLKPQKSQKNIIKTQNQKLVQVPLKSTHGQIYNQTKAIGIEQPVKFTSPQTRVIPLQSSLISPPAQYFQSAPSQLVYIYIIKNKSIIQFNLLHQIFRAYQDPHSTQAKFNYLHHFDKNNQNPFLQRTQVQSSYISSTQVYHQPILR